MLAEGFLGLETILDDGVFVFLTVNQRKFKSRKTEGRTYKIIVGCCAVDPEHDLLGLLMLALSCVEEVRFWQPKEEDTEDYAGPGQLIQMTLSLSQTHLQ